VGEDEFPFSFKTTSISKRRQVDKIRKQQQQQKLLPNWYPSSLCQPLLLPNFEGHLMLFWLTKTAWIPVWQQLLLTDMPFLSPNQQCESTAAKARKLKLSAFGLSNNNKWRWWL